MSDAVQFIRSGNGLRLSCARVRKSSSNTFLPSATSLAALRSSFWDEEAGAGEGRVGVTRRDQNPEDDHCASNLAVGTRRDGPHAGS